MRVCLYAGLRAGMMYVLCVFLDVYFCLHGFVCISLFVFMYVCIGVLVYVYLFKINDYTDT